MDYLYVTKTKNISENGKTIESDKIQIFENAREKRVQGIHNGKPFMYIQKKPKFSLFPPKHVHFQPSFVPNKSTKKKRTPTPYLVKTSPKRKKQKKNNTKKNKKILV